MSKWDSEDSYLPLRMRVCRGLRTGGLFFGMSVFFLLVGTLLSAILGEPMEPGFGVLLWLSFVMWFLAPLGVAVLRPAFRRIPGAILTSIVLGVPLIVLAFAPDSVGSDLRTVLRTATVMSLLGSPVAGVMCWAWPKARRTGWFWARGPGDVQYVPPDVTDILDDASERRDGTTGESQRKPGPHQRARSSQGSRRRA